MDNKVRQYLKEWREEKDFAKEHAQDPGFSWDRHDKELISIQKAIRTCYEEADEAVRASLTEAEAAEINAILMAEID